MKSQTLQVLESTFVDDHDTEAKTHFLMELNGFLRAYGCPYPQLADVELEKRLSDKESRLILLSYLISEYQAAQIQFTDHPSDLPLPTGGDTVSYRHPSVWLVDSPGKQI